MKTPWSDLIEYGVGVAAIIVMLITGIALFGILGTVVMLVKLFTFIR